ncbi:MAG: hypothetical protein ACJ72Z_11045 [Pyrinomonadaceae bacterium]
MNPLDKNQPGGQQEPEILVNQNQVNLDPTVVVDEAKRTVVLTEDETIVIEKQEQLDIVPVNRPRKVYRGMWGPMEIAAFAVSIIVLFAVVALYMFFVAPSNRKLEETRAERDRLEQERNTAVAQYGDITTTETAVAKLVSSVSDFESVYLPIASNGRTSLYQRLNGLIASYGLTNTNGPNYSPLELNEEQKNGEEGQQGGQERGRQKYKSIFPGVYVTMTVEGSYQNLRRFIREIETGNEFVIISSIELEPTETKKKENDESKPQQGPQTATQPAFGSNSARAFDPRNPTVSRMPAQPMPQQPAGAPSQEGKVHGETVSLRLEMAAYFRRLNFVPAGGEAVQ